MATDQTVQVLDNFYNLDLTVDANEYEIVYSYFISVCSTESVAKSFTETLFRVSSVTKTTATELLQSLQGKSLMQMQLTLAYYLNTISETKSVLYGVSSVITPNEKIQRNVIQ